jgi:thymidylate synthase ThyX
VSYSARILADSVNPVGNRLTTMLVTYPRLVHAEHLRHRVFSFSVMSSRAIPVSKMIEQVETDPVMPVYWGKNRSGMQANEELEHPERTAAEMIWLSARDRAVNTALCLNDLHVHKALVNRLLEPWQWVTVIVSATEWANFFHLRCHPDAQPEIRKIAEMMRELYEASRTFECEPGEWHLPLISLDDADLSAEDLRKASVGRCARVSYLTHSGTRDPQADIDLCDRLAASGHWSPFEHVAMALDEPTRVGNLIGWRQFRKDFEGEHFGSVMP